jgi:tetratricopeptide (TPR) repeat protein
LLEDRQLDAAEEAASRLIDLLTVKGEQLSLCQGYQVLSRICRFKGKIKEAADHSEAALRITTSDNWDRQQIWNEQQIGITHSLAELCFDEGKFDEAYAHIERAKSQTVDDPYNLGYAMLLQVRFLYKQHRFEEAKPEALRTIDVFEKFGVAEYAERGRKLLRDIEEGTETLVTSGESDSNGELLETALLPTAINSPFLARGTE